MSVSAYAETGMLRLVKSLNLSWQKARPRHPKADRKAPTALKKGLPDLLTAVAAEHPEAEQLELWFMDQARVGQCP